MAAVNPENIVQILQIQVDLVDPSPFQPRKYFDQDKADSLASSVKEHGVQQAVKVRPHPTEAGRYQLAYGECRLRACKKLGLATIPAVVEQLSDQQMLEIGLEENLKRQSLTYTEEAESFKRVLESYNGDIERAEKRLSVKRKTILQRIALLGLPVEVQAWVDVKKLSLGCANVIAELVEDPEDQLKYATFALKRKKTETQMRKHLQNELKQKAGKPDDSTDEVGDSDSQDQKPADITSEVKNLMKTVANLTRMFSRFKGFDALKAERLMCSGLKNQLEGLREELDEFEDKL